MLHILKSWSLSLQVLNTMLGITTQNWKWDQIIKNLNTNLSSLQLF